jgi:hypothetical protein
MSYDHLFVIPGQMLPLERIEITLQDRHVDRQHYYMRAGVGRDRGLDVEATSDYGDDDDLNLEVHWFVPGYRIPELLALIPTHPQHIGRALEVAADSTEGVDAFRKALNAMDPRVETYVNYSR